MVEVTVDEMKAVSSLITGVLLLLFGISLAVGIVAVQGMNQGLTYGLLAISTILIINGAWEFRKSQRTATTV
jgi:fumarate reductase subunit D